MYFIACLNAWNSDERWSRLILCLFDWHVLERSERRRKRKWKSDSCVFFFVFSSSFLFHINFALPFVASLLFIAVHIVFSIHSLPPTRELMSTSNSFFSVSLERNRRHVRARSRHTLSNRKMHFTDACKGWCSRWKCRQVSIVFLKQFSTSFSIPKFDFLFSISSVHSIRFALFDLRSATTFVFHFVSSIRDGLTALHCAASRGHTECISVLINLCGAPTDLIDSNGCTALHYAVTLGHADATYVLLDLGADPNRQDRKGRTPAHCGCAKGQFETVNQSGNFHSHIAHVRLTRRQTPTHKRIAHDFNL